MKPVIVVLILAVLSACRGGQSAAPDGRDFPHTVEAIDRHAPSMDDLLALTYSGTDAGTVTLASGVWHGAGQRGDPGVAELELVKGFRLTGDITGNGRNEAVVLLAFRRPPADARTYVAVVGSLDGHLVNIATAPVSEQVEVRGGRIEPGRIVLDGVRRAPAGSPTEAVSLTYDLRGRDLRSSGG